MNYISPHSKSCIKGRWNDELYKTTKTSASWRQFLRDREKKRINKINKLCTTEENIHFAVHKEHTEKFVKGMQRINKVRDYGVVVYKISP